MRSSLLPTALFVAGLCVLAALPWAASSLREGGVPRCALDGVEIAANPVTVRTESGASRTFCCVDCAQEWIARSRDRPADVLVTDETSGREISARDAWFVRSRVESNAVTGCHVHAFADESDALRHVAAFGGLVLVGGSRPFGGEQ